GAPVGVDEDVHLAVGAGERELLAVVVGVARLAVDKHGGRGEPRTRARHGQGADRREARAHAPGYSEATDAVKARRSPATSTRRRAGRIDSARQAPVSGQARSPGGTWVSGRGNARGNATSSARLAGSTQALVTWTPLPSLISRRTNQGRETPRTPLTPLRPRRRNAGRPRALSASRSPPSAPCSPPPWRTGSS